VIESHVVYYIVLKRTGHVGVTSFQY
jgi:hypothetical protein